MNRYREREIYIGDSEVNRYTRVFDRVYLFSVGALIGAGVMRIVDFFTMVG